MRFIPPIEVIYDARLTHSMVGAVPFKGAMWAHVDLPSLFEIAYPRSAFLAMPLKGSAAKVTLCDPPTSE